MKKQGLAHRGMRFLCVLLVLTAGNGGVIFASQDMGEPEESTDAFRSFYERSLKLPQDVFFETKEIAQTGDNLFWLLLAGGGSLALDNTSANKDIAENFENHRMIRQDADKLVDLFGGPGLHFGLAGTWYLLSAHNNDIVGQEESWTMFKALSVTGATTLGLKLLRDNDTPNGKTYGWPSGHTASSFTVASVINELYGPEIGIPAYIGAGFVGYRMMDSGDHWASDVLFGAVLGTVVGSHFGKKHNMIKSAGFEMLPYITVKGHGPMPGISLTKQF
jgi:membrane-associated phospholipid phosphatase